MESPPVYPVQQTASATLQRQHCVRRSIPRECCDRARDGRPLLALRSPPSVQAPRMSGFPCGGSRHGVRRSKSPACPALPEHYHHSAKSACNRIPVLERPASTRESCNLHWAVASGRSLYCHRIVLLSRLLILVGTEEPPSAATRQATNGWRLQHIIYTALGEVACAEGGGYVDSVWALRRGGLQVHSRGWCERQFRQAVEDSSMGTRMYGDGQAAGGQQEEERRQDDTAPRHMHVA